MMCQSGCLVTSLAMLLRHYGAVTDSNVNSFNPWIFNERLKQVNGFTSAANMYYAAVTKLYPGFVFQGITAYSASQLSSLYNQGYASIVKAQNRNSHYVAIRDASNHGNILIMDPGSGATNLSYYGGGKEIIYYKTSGTPAPTNQTPVGALDTVRAENGRVYVSGWAIDPDSPRTALDVHFYIGGVRHALKADQSRQDVENAHASINPGPNHGFSGWINTDKTGDVIFWGAAIDTAGGTNLTSPNRTIHINPKSDTTPPVLTDIKATKDQDGYTVTCRVSDESGIDRVLFRTWTLNNGQDDLAPDWVNNSSLKGTLSGNTVSFRVNIADHFGEYGQYVTDIYAYDIYGNVSFSRIGVNMDDQIGPPPGSYTHYGKIGTAWWTIDNDGVLAILEGEFANEDHNYSWPWTEYINNVTRVDGTASFQAKGDWSSAFKVDADQSAPVLYSIDLSGWDTSETTDLSSMFEGQSALTELNLDGWNTSSVQSMAAMFKDCTSLEYVPITYWDTSSVRDMSAMLQNCRSIHALELIHLDTSSLEFAALMFWGCSSLINLDLHSWETSQLKEIEYMFGSCTSLTSLNVGTWDTPELENLTGVFSDCPSLQSLDIGFWDTSLASSMEQAFYNCSSLSSIRYSQNALNLLALLPRQSGWMQEKSGPYSISELPEIPLSTTALLTLTDDPVSIYEASVTGIQPSYPYTGSAILPEPVVMIGSQLLVKGRDYTLSYSNNINPGTATMTIRGIGSFTGSMTKSFIIEGNKTDDDSPAQAVAMHRLYNPNSGEHFYTGSDRERDFLVSSGWKSEGEGWNAPASSSSPVYRLYNQNAGDHHYTTSATEKEYLISVGWKD